MHLLDILRARSVPGAGVFLFLTRKCPLSCAHCSTNSSKNSVTALNRSDLLNFVESFRDSVPPDIVALTGGEPLVRPHLVREIAESAREAGVKTYVISGMFFAAQSTLPPAVESALRCVNHISASIDKYHEREISRSSVFSALAKIMELGVAVSIQTVAAEEGDPYVDSLVRDVRGFFDDRVPLLVTQLKPHGRGSALFASLSEDASRIDLSPCRFSSWPVVSDAGTIVACCNQAVVDGPAPSHLLIGALAELSWGDVRRKVMTSGVLRELRTRGPCAIALAANGQAVGFCESCRTLEGLEERFDQQPSLVDRLREGVVAELIAEAFIPTAKAYRHLATLGSARE